MSKGRVKGYFPLRGFGSIVDSATGHKLIVYANYVSLLKGVILKEGQEVEYEIEKQRNESWAINVRFSLKQEEENRHVAI
jgi:cold shock CspA family protein